MLREIRIENLLLIERAELLLGEGLNVITGETGAGKTILAHSLDLLLGGRARPQIVRPQAEEAWVEGVFDLPAGVLEEPELAGVAERLPRNADEVVLGRRVFATGRTSAYLGGRSASASELAALGGRLLSFYGQHEHRKLALASAQLDVLDGFAGSEQLDAARRYRAAHREVAGYRRQIGELRELDGARERSIDLARYELQEIEALALDPSEEEGLAAERERLRNSDALRLASAGALEAIYGEEDATSGAALLLAEAQSLLADQRRVDPCMGELSERLAALTTELTDVAGELRSHIDGIEADPTRLSALEERADALERLKRKHGGSIHSVLEHARECGARISSLENAEERSAELERGLASAEERRGDLARRLSASRRSAARRLERRVGEELERLAMPGAALRVLLRPHPDGFGQAGSETVELQVASNPGIEPAPLRDAASGGELSRIMLALCGLSSGSDPATVCFDEIDDGVGGKAARVVGERLRALAESRQVICITHLPQVASLAGTHFRISKSLIEGAATASVEQVRGEELVGEICRMLGSEISDDAARGHARRLLAAA